MPILSAYTQLGHLRLTSKPAHGETFSKALRAGINDGVRTFSVEEGSRMDGWIYATAMTCARLRYAIEGSDQSNPMNATDLLPVLEDQWGIVAYELADVLMRRRALRSRRRIPVNGSAVAIRNALNEVLGFDFVAYIPTPRADAVVFPADLGDQPQNIQPPETVRKLIRLAAPVSVGLGSPQAVAYAPVDEQLDPASHILEEGDVLVVEPERQPQTEVVTVTAVSTVGGELRFTATFNNPHNTGSVCSTAPFPYWVSTKRHSLVVLSAAAAADPERRRLADDVMRRFARAVSTWDLVGLDTPSSAGPFRVGVGLVGVTPIGLVNV